MERMMSKEKSQIHFLLGDEQEIVEMIESRKWWILVGSDSVYDEFEAKFYPRAVEDLSFITVFGPPPGDFAKHFGGLMVLHFARKDKLDIRQLIEFFNQHPDRQGLPPMLLPDADKDIIFLLREGGLST
jgi:hypothetical protein